jgi:predicted ATP-grasp superfamily ATP-dependent carboligase
MNLLLFEWSFAGGPGSRSLLPEGFGMLRSMAECLRQEDVEISIISSNQYKKIAASLDVENVILADENPGKTYEERSQEFDYSFIIAPESHGILGNLTSSTSPDTQLLSCPPETVRLFSDKDKTNQLMVNEAQELRVPDYRSTNGDSKEVRAAAEDIGFPCVVKPPDGAGSNGTSILRTSHDIPPACATLKASGFQEALVQKYIRGRHLSATFHVSQGKLTPLVVNLQSISPSNSMAYMGGSSPYPFDKTGIWDDLERVAARGSLGGMMGMDFVVGDDDTYFMEINPRVTTSCIGLSKILSPSLGNMIMSGRVETPKLDGYAQWSILPLQRSIRAEENILPTLFEIPQIISPPFPVGPYFMKDSSRVLVCVWGSDSLELPIMLGDVKNRLAGMHILC